MKNVFLVPLIAIIAMIVACTGKGKSNNPVVQDSIIEDSVDKCSVDLCKGRIIEDTVIGHWSIKTTKDSNDVLFVAHDDWEVRDSSVFLTVAYDGKPLFTDKEIRTKDVIGYEGRHIMYGGGHVEWVSDSAIYVSFASYMPDTDVGAEMLCQVTPEGDAYFFVIQSELDVTGFEVISNFLALYFNERAVGSSISDMQRLYEKYCTKEVADGLLTGTVRFVADDADFRLADRTLQIDLLDNSYPLEKYPYKVKFSSNRENESLVDSIYIEIVEKPIRISKIETFSVGSQINGVRTKCVDNGGSGEFKAIAVTEDEMPDYVIYRPADIKQASADCGRLPVLMWANGACWDSSIDYERFLTEIASHGYVVMAIGEMQETRDDRPMGHTESSELKRGLDWLIRQAANEGSAYYNNIDTLKIAAAGHSCGGAQVLANAADPRLATCLIMNAGMGDIEMAGASRESLPDLHCPVLYVTGGPDDIAYRNAEIDYSRISHVPVTWADHAASGHGGTYGALNGGDYARVAIDWLDWQLKGENVNAELFVDGAESYDGWAIKAKNFSISD